VERPDTRYAWSSDFAIAYQVMGSGAANLVYLPFFMSNVEVNWQVPPLAALLEDLSSVCRLVVMDRRGFGCSDRLPPGSAATLEDMADDIVAVMEAAGCGRRTYLLAGQESGFAAMLAAATHPDRFAGLILFGASAAYLSSEDLPWESSADEWAAAAGSWRRMTSAAEMTEFYVRNTLPSVAGDRQLIRQLAALLATSEGLGGVLADYGTIPYWDLRDLVPTITTPTLLLYRTHDRVAPVEGGRYLAERIPGARLVELPGLDTQPWAGDSTAVVAEIRAFVTGDRVAPEPTRWLATVLFTDIVGSTERLAAMGDARWREVIDRHDELARAAVERYRGQYVHSTGDGLLATFDGPARAVRCAQAIVDAVRPLGLEVRAGLHAGEVERAGHGAAGVGVHIGARVAALAGPSEVFVSSTVKDLTAGSGLQFEDRGEHDLKGVPDRWRLYRVTTGAS
jgi:pimeloyl-ACP methyl ester carboxylesterase